MRFNLSMKIEYLFNLLEIIQLFEISITPRKLRNCRLTNYNKIVSTVYIVGAAPGAKRDIELAGRAQEI